jgi:hypothetical protein
MGCAGIGGLAENTPLARCPQHKKISSGSYPRIRNLNLLGRALPVAPHAIHRVSLPSLAYRAPQDFTHIVVEIIHD